MKADKFRNIDEYIAGCDAAVQPALMALRAIIRKAAPEAHEVISYNMPAFKQKKVLVYFAACKNNLGFYPTPAPIQAFEKELAGYTTTNGAVHFSLHQPLPEALISAMVRFCVAADLQGP